MERAAIIFNPVARNAPSRERLAAAAASMKDEGWEVAVFESEAPLHAAVLARQAAEGGARVVFACGGDGTVNEVVNGIYGTPACLGVLRAGTGNVFGKEVRVPRRIESALDVLRSGREHRFDLGYAAGDSIERLPEPAASGRRYFLLMCGIGFDGAVVRRVPPGPKRFLGTTSYVLWGAAEAVRFKSRVVKALVDGREVDGELYWILLGNTRSYGGVADVAMDAVADDGLLEVYLFAGRGIPWILSMGARIALKKHQKAKDVTYARGASVNITTPGLHVQADGEYFGETPMSFGVEPRALSVLLVPGSADRILSR